MKVVSNITSRQVVNCLLGGGVVVARTDTLYGVLALANSEAAVSRVYRIKGRSQHKSPIVLISRLDQLHDRVPEPTKRLMDEYWPGPVSIIVPTRHAPQWLRRGNDSVAYRLPDHRQLYRLIDQTGPLIAPSANPEGLSPASSLERSIEYFGEEIDVYVDGGEVLNAEPSMLMRLQDSGEVERLR